ncbi:signal peptidase I [Streptomyces sp. NPDC098789]|uniref:signal peptidase I n=1 Tax=Streptomyces sp. NPDC098789 TaxID=3366098 RepID=UPI00382DCA86
MLDALVLLCTGLLIALGVKTFLVQTFSIPSESMQHTLEIGDVVLVDKLTPWFAAKPARGEVVVFRDPGNWVPPKEKEAEPDSGVVRLFNESLAFVGLRPPSNGQHVIKRVIAVGGDVVECKKDGPVTVNGHALDEPYLYPMNRPCGDKPFGPLTVPRGRIWVMGDHRERSADSRYHLGDEGQGTVSEGDVVGRALVIAWPFGRWGSI